ncbi:MAG: hypothetical protein ACNS64_06905 [Candidatus Halalkalibacterium sp. M3_1C_030]
MEMVKVSGRIYKKCTVLLLFSFFVTVSGFSQNTFLSDSPGFFTFGQFSQVQNFDGPAIGLSYSINGKTALGISYGSNSLNNKNYQSVSVLANLLIKKQSEGDVVNFEVMPSFERKYHNLTDQHLSLFSLGTGVSRDLSNEAGLNLIPRATFSYLMSPSVGLTNYLAAGLDVGIGYDINSNIKLIVNPGMNVRLDNGRYNGIFTSGLLIH